MEEEKIENKRGRPRKVINWDVFEKLCNLQCSQSEIANFFEIHPDTLVTHVKEHYEDNWVNTYKRYCEGGYIGLRRNQYRLSKRNAAMAIFLGKNWLGQTDGVNQNSDANSQESVERFNAFMSQLERIQSPKDAFKSSNTESMS